MDNILYNVGADISLVKKDIRILAKKLSCGDLYRFGIFHCQGVVEVAKDSDRGMLSFDLIFNIPQEFCYKPETLRSILRSRMNYTLTKHIVLAK